MVPGCVSASSNNTSRPASARARATARPTTPAPTTTHSILSAIYSIYHANIPSLPRSWDAGCRRARILQQDLGQPLRGHHEPAAPGGAAAYRDAGDGQLEG